VLAHCTHLYDAEASALAAIGASIASCPHSNMLFARAVLPVNRFRALGVKIGLGTDIAGGHSASMVDAVRMAGLVSRIEGFRPPVDRTGDPHEDLTGEEPSDGRGDEESVDYKTAFHMATRGGALALGLEKVGVFEVGMQFDAVQIDLTWDKEDDELESEETQFERWVCGHGGEGSVKTVWVNGRTVFCT
jgi:guanine deaminase